MPCQIEIPQTNPLGVPQEQWNRMVAYAKELRRKHPQMKPDRVKRKVAEYFKIKLV